MKIIRYVVSMCMLMSGIAISAKKNKDKSNFEHIKHNIQLQLADASGFAVPDTQFWVPLDIIKQGPLVTVQVPLINFQTLAAPSPDNPFDFVFVPGGYLYTSDGFLPEYLRPNDLVPVSIIGASNDGMSPVFSFTQSPTTLPVPPAGYIVQVTNAGAFQVQCAGTFGNVIPPGPQILMPCTLTYIIGEKQKLCKNVTLSDGQTNVTQFDYAFTIRDFHVNDAFDGTVAWAWQDNSMIADKASSLLNVMVAVGETDAKGNIKNLRKTQLTDFTTGQVPPGPTADFDTSVTIVRNGPNKGAIVVSYCAGDPAAPPFGISLPYRAVSFDNGLTWPINGPIEGPANIQPSGNPSGNGDIRGVGSDKFGNVWYCISSLYTDFGGYLNQPYFIVSTDGGVTYELIYTASLPDFIPGVSLYDFPSYSFGGLGDGSGTYGMWFALDYFQNGFDNTPIVGFIPIFGLNDFGTPMILELTNEVNSELIPCITASADGRVWIQGYTASPASFISPIVMRFKSPGAFNANYAGVFDIAMVNALGISYHVTNTISFTNGYFNGAPQIIYDDNRHALYSLINNQVPDFSQNMQNYFVISRDNGLTWSAPIPINNTNFANRGFISMALDPVTGHLVFGWYDGRNTNPNSPTAFQTLEYMAAVIPASTLDELVNAIPPSNPVFEVPA